eukprot:GDKI01002694.1.p1 GENE.GDKI01002694.1~~GDKI01002694.1.p1  ORF type:complete len:718 (-),score=150.91 GDKI01002694.1:54-1943(-)
MSPTGFTFHSCMTKRYFAVQTAVNVKLDEKAKEIPMENIRNFCIIAHVDHGKSTLSDRLLQATNTIPKDSASQFLDNLEVERQRGITIKAQTCSMFFDNPKDNKRYLLNLIDTPGHADFQYEVSRSMTACQGAVLLVAACEGVEAQTVANFYQAYMKNLHIIGCVSKVDMPNSTVEQTKDAIHKLTDIPRDELLCVSGKTGAGVQELLEKVCETIPPPEGDRTKTPKMLLFDSWYDLVKGVVLLVAVKDGSVKRGDKLMAYQSNKMLDVHEVGLLHPTMQTTAKLQAGQVGYICANLRQTRDVRVGDTLFDHRHIGTPFPEFKPARCMVYAGIYPEYVADMERLTTAMQRLTLTDAAIESKAEVSDALGHGFRCGFLGLLHMDVFKQRLEAEHGVRVLITTPTVPYKVTLHKGEEIMVEKAEDYPEPSSIKKIEEPIVNATIIVPQDCAPEVAQLCIERRGVQVSYEMMDGKKVMLQYKMPLMEVILDFFDKLLSMTRGMATYDYEPIGYQEADIVKVNMKLNGEQVDALSFLTLRDKSHEQGTKFCQRLAKLIPPSQFEIAIQCFIGGKIVAKEKIKALRKDVTAKCYGGDMSRKMKLLERQKEGKKRLREICDVQVPPEAFLELLKI